MTTAEQFLRASDNADLYNDKLLADLEQDRLETIDNLLNETGERDPELWDEMGVDDELVMSDYEEVETDERNIEWALGLAGLIGASYLNYFLMNREDTIINAVAYREQTVSSLEIDSVELVRAGKRGIQIDGLGKFEILQSKYKKDLEPFMRLTNTELYDALREAGALRPYDRYVEDAMSYVNRMTDYKPESPQWKEAVNDLVDTGSKQNIDRMNRRSVERLHSYRETGGNPETPMVWIGEADSNTCDYCRARFGRVETYADWVELGLPGADVCRGGDRCRCHLAAI